MKGVLDHFYCECGGEKMELLGGTLRISSRQYSKQWKESKTPLIHNRFSRNFVSCCATKNRWYGTFNALVNGLQYKFHEKAQVWQNLTMYNIVISHIL